MSKEQPEEVALLLARIERAEQDIERRKNQALQMVTRGERNLKKAIADEDKRLRAEHAAIQAEIDRQRADLEAREDALQPLLDDRVAGFDILARAWADFEEARAETEAVALETKAHPARGAADQIRAKGQQVADMAPALHATPGAPSRPARPPYLVGGHRRTGGQRTRR